MRFALWIVLAVVVAVCVAVAAGAWRWRSRTDRLHARLMRARTAVVPPAYDESILQQVPPPVQRYFRTVLKQGQPMIAVARFTHTGTFNMGETTPSWRSFSSAQIVTTSPPGFDWDARVRMAPGVSAFVHDAYVAGEGLLHAEALGLFTVADMRGTPDLAQGELLRYLAEGMWYPTALLPGRGLVWTPIDDVSARATLTDGATTVSLDFRFGPDGLIESSFASGHGHGPQAAAPLRHRGEEGPGGTRCGTE